MVETKHERFIRLAENRTNGIIDALKVLGNLANKNNYAYTKNDTDKMFKAIEKALAETRSKFCTTDIKEKTRFTFND